MPTVTPPTITVLPAPPDPNNRATFNTLAYPWSVAQGVLATQVGAAATNVKANADDAASSATVAATQVGLATDAANAASISTLSSLTRSQAAAASLFSIQNLTNQFNITYLGVKSADPTLDNMGAPLISGAFYTSTTTNTIRTYTGTAWVQGVSVTAGVTSVNGVAGTVVNIATTGANIFTGRQSFATGAAIVSAATVNLDTALDGNRHHITGTTTITAVTLTRGPRTVIFDGVLTLTHNATTNNLPGAANITTAVGDRAIYESDGATVYCVSYVKASGMAVIATGDHEIAVYTGNAHGSTNTCIRRFTTTLTSTGTAITYADSATLGAAFTINETGLYSIYYADTSGASAGQQFGVSLNSTQLSTTLILNPVASRLMVAVNAIAGLPGGGVSRMVRLIAGDVVRPHTSGTVDSVQPTVFFAIRKAGI